MVNICGRWLPDSQPPQSDRLAVVVVVVIIFLLLSFAVEFVSAAAAGKGEKSPPISHFLSHLSLRQCPLLFCGDDIISYCGGGGGGGGDLLVLLVQYW